MSETALVYLIIKLAEFLLLYYSGSLMSRAPNNSTFWKIAVYPIVIYALIEGLRWGHMIDYNVYADRFMAINDFITTAEHSSPLFTIIVFSLKKLGCSYPLFLVIQCGFLMYSALLLFQDYKKYACWILPCLLITFAINENFIRFYLGLSFIYISLYFLLRNQFYFFVIFGLLGCLTHFGLVIVFFFFLFSGIINKKMIPSMIAAVLFVVSSFLASIKNFEFLVTWSNFATSFFEGSEYALINYAKSMDKIIVGEGGANLGIMQKSLSSQIKTMVTFLPMIFLAPKWIREYKWGPFMYNVTVIAAILTPVFGSVELLGRFCNAISIFTPIVVAGTFVNFAGLFDEKKSVSIALLLYVSLFLFFWSYANAPFVRKDYEMYFIWDSNGAMVNWLPYGR